MSRSSKKGPFVEERLLGRIQKMNESGSKQMVRRSAVANAESNPALHWDGDELVVHAVYIDEGPTIKRWRPRARGRVARIRKRTCHITIEVAQREAAN